MASMTPTSLADRPLLYLQSEPPERLACLLSTDEPMSVVEHSASVLLDIGASTDGYAQASVP